MDKKNVDWQKWYDDSATGTIRSKHNGFCMDIECNVLVSNPYESDKDTQQWIRKDHLIVNRKDNNTCLNFNQGTTYLGRVISHPINSPVPNSQLWTFEQA
jgi:hypothetical protein